MFDSLVLLQSVLVLVGHVAHLAPGRPVEGRMRVGEMSPGIGVESELPLTNGALATALGCFENAFET